MSDILAIKYKKLQGIIQSQASRDGDGVLIQRVAGPELNVWMDPYLMLDEMRSDDAADYIGGFPPHPHRGFETITYMIEGRMRHRDHMGNEGLIVSGGVQWMTAARGVIHSEMPEQEAGLLHGFQLWLNLPAAEKMKNSAYQDIPKESVPELRATNGSLVKVLAGKIELNSGSAIGPIKGLTTNPHILDVQMPENSELELDLPEGQRTLVYAFGGDFEEIPFSHMGFYGEGDKLKLTTQQKAARALVLSGNPLKEPIVQQGPFVMNSIEEIQQAITDYQNGVLAN